MGEFIEVLIKKLTQDAIIPTKGSEYAAGNDLYSIEPDFILMPGETKKVRTGIAIELPEWTFGAIFARSGAATKRGLRPANCVGVIDEDYRGEIIVALHNDSKEPQKVLQYERIAQLVVIPYERVKFEEVENLTSTERQDGGFGSSER